MSEAYNLEERTAQFGENIIKLSTPLKLTAVSRPIVNQLVRAATSVGANYMEANGASSRNDFRNKIFICKKEVQEVKHWLRMLKQCFPEKSNEIKILWDETHELNLIFQKITTSLKTGAR